MLREISTQLSALLHSRDLQKSGSFAISKKIKKSKQQQKEIQLKFQSVLGFQYNFD